MVELARLPGPKRLLRLLMPRSDVTGTVDDNEDSRAAEAGGGADEIEGGIEHGLGGGEDDGEVLGLATGHDGVGGDFADGNFAATLGEAADDFVGGSLSDGEEFFDALYGGRDDGETVGPAEGVALLNGLNGIVPLSLNQRAEASCFFPFQEFNSP